MLEIVILFLLICLNGLLAMSEIAVVSSRRVRLEQHAARGESSAKAALALVDSPTHFLSTVQIGITLIGILAGAFGEAALSDDLAPLIARIPGLEHYSQPIASVIIVLAITYFSLVIGELVPKRLGMHAPERIAQFVARPMQILSMVTAPAVKFLTFSTELVLWVSRVRPRAEEDVTEADIRGMIDKGASVGVIDEKERELVDRIFRLGDLQVAALMIPRNQIDWLDVDYSSERIRVAVATSSHSHFPVCRGGLDDLLGVVHVKDLIKHGLITGRVDLKSLVQPPMFVPEATLALTLLERFKSSGTHLAFVLDEYGGVEGLITLNDLVEAILGQATRTGEELEPMIVRRPDGSRLLDGLLPVEDLKRELELETLPQQDVADYQTLGGMIVTHLGHIPRSSESFVWDRWRFEVVDMDRFRVDKVLVTAAEGKTAGGDGKEDDPGEAI